MIAHYLYYDTFTSRKGNQNALIIEYSLNLYGPNPFKDVLKIKFP